MNSDLAGVSGLSLFQAADESREHAGDDLKLSSEIPNHVVLDGAAGDVASCTSACTSNGQNERIDADPLEVVADLLADLPADQLGEVIAELTPAERAVVARLLIGKNCHKGDPAK